MRRPWSLVAASILRSLASGPAADRTVSWVVDPGWEDIGGAVAWDGHHESYGIVARAVNAGGASHWVVASGGNGWSCGDCTY